MLRYKIKSKAVPLLTCGRQGKMSIALTHSWPRHKMVWVVSVTPRPRFTPGKRTTSTHWTGGRVDLRADLNTESRGKVLCLCRGSDSGLPVVQCVVRHNTDWATPAPYTFVWCYNFESVRKKMVQMALDRYPIFVSLSLSVKEIKLLYCIISCNIILIICV
jgi:hypothetical protein